jgi:hypothetical protein
MAIKTTSFKNNLGGGQFEPDLPGQFAPDWGGQLRPERGGHIDRIFQYDQGNENMCMPSIFEYTSKQLCNKGITRDQ